MASRDSLSMLVTLELRERVNELSLASEQQDESEHKNEKCGNYLGNYQIHRFTHDFIHKAGSRDVICTQSILLPSV